MSDEWRSRPATASVALPLGQLMALWCSGMAMSLSYSSIIADPSPILRPLSSVSNDRTNCPAVLVAMPGVLTNVVIQLLSPIRSNTTVAFSALAVLVFSGVLYVTMLRSVLSRYGPSGLKATLASIALVLLESFWTPEAFTMDERFLILLPASFNFFLTMAAVSHQPTAVVVPEKWGSDEK